MGSRNRWILGFDTDMALAFSMRGFSFVSFFICSSITWREEVLLFRLFTEFWVEGCELSVLG